MTLSIEECPNCHFRFNYTYTMGMSIHAIRLGTKRKFMCPSCKTRQIFILQHSEKDESLPAYDDTFTASDAALLILSPVPFIALMLYLSLTLTGLYQILGLFLPIAGMVVTLGVILTYTLFVSEIRKVA